MSNQALKKILIILSGVFVALPFSFCLTGCAPIEADDVLNAIFPNLWVFLAHLFATLVLLALCVWLVWKPSKETLKKRNEYIQDQIKQAEETRKEALMKLAEAQKEKVNAHVQAQNIISVANSQAYQLKDKIESEARNNAKKITEDAVNDSIKIKEDIYSRMNKEILDIAFDASSSLLKKKVTRKDSDEFVNDFIKQVKENKGDKE